VHLTQRAADAATPRANRGGFRAKVLRLPSCVDGAAPPLTPSLGSLTWFDGKQAISEITLF